MIERLLNGLLWIVGLVRNRPKLAIEYAPLDGMSGAGTAGKLMVRWRYRVTITNLAKEDALVLAVIHTNNRQLEKLGHHHIRGLEHVAIERRLERELDKPAVVAAGHDFHGALEPLELSDLALTLRYKSSSGVTCYTEYVRRRHDDANRWPLWMRKEPKGNRSVAQL